MIGEIGWVEGWEEGVVGMCAIIVHTLKEMRLLSKRQTRRQASDQKTVIRHRRQASGTKTGISHRSQASDTQGERSDTEDKNQTQKTSLDRPGA